MMIFVSQTLCHSLLSVHSKTTNPANEPVLRDVEVQVGHDAEDAYTEISDGEIDQEEVDVVPHLTVAENNEYYQQIACSDNNAALVTRQLSLTELLAHKSDNKKDGYRQLNVRQLSSLRPWDHRGKCYIDRKRIQCLTNAPQPFLKYSSGGSRGRPPIDLTNFCINVKSHLRMHPNPPFSGENSFFLWRGTAPSQTPPLDRLPPL